MPADYNVRNHKGIYKVIGDPELQALAERFLALLIEENFGGA